LVRLRSRRERDRTATFLVEGYRELCKAAASSTVIDEVYYAPDLYLGANEPALIDQLTAAGARAIRLGADAFRKVAYRDRPDGLLAVARQFDTSLDGIPITANPLLLVVEAIEKPGNLGTMLRTADAAGANAVIACDPTTDLFNPNTIRASVGSLFSLPVATATTAETIEWLHTNSVRALATSPYAERVHWETDLRGPVAVVVGSEQYGLNERWLAPPITAVRIPMGGTADSLNAAMAAGIVLFEAVRQRTSEGATPETA
ncbi:MAG: RNA methyltransferase, partial [Acidimicrobiia bacterium]|nr:RNA methyltransferase [Acidimicrobiia bacterium]